MQSRAVDVWVEDGGLLLAILYDEVLLAALVNQLGLDRVRDLLRLLAAHHQLLVEAEARVGVEVEVSWIEDHVGVGTA